jgi:CDP-diacylglycerol--glycerol-3-phosphate 3-phosphatidyltransferase
MWLLAVASLITCAQRLHAVRTSPGATDRMVSEQ